MENVLIILIFLIVAILVIVVILEEVFDFFTKGSNFFGIYLDGGDFFLILDSCIFLVAILLGLLEYCSKIK